MGDQTNSCDGFQVLTHTRSRFIAPGSSLHPACSSQLFDDIERVLGEGVEPDPLFFLQCWTINISSAVESFKRRHSGQCARWPKVDSTTEVFKDGEGAWQEDPGIGDSFIGSPCASASGREESGRSLDVPARQSGLRPGYICGDCYEHAAESGPVVHPIDRAGAYLILGVQADCTPRQVKAAYRRRVGQWHPDRIEHGSEGARVRATEQMAAINAAYRLLCRDSTRP